MKRDFIDLRDISSHTLRALIDEAKVIKSSPDHYRTALTHKKLAMIFEKNSTRTRVSFEVGMMELGGQALFLSSHDLQLGRGETIVDTARVLSRYVDAIMLRCHSHSTMLELADAAQVPVINGLTQALHPCQLMADILTIEEHLGAIAGKTISWIGDGNNMANSFATAAQMFDFTLRLSCPAQLSADGAVIAQAMNSGADIHIIENPQEAAAGADVIVTDTWVSMGDEDEQKRMALLEPYRVTQELMQYASPEALFLHCLPAHRGEEVTAEVLDGSQSVVWDEAENRLHAQKAVLKWCME